MFAHVLYCLNEIEAELENLTSSPPGSELVADLDNHLQAMRRLVASAAEMSGSNETASGTEAFLLSAEDDVAIAFHEEVPATGVATLEAQDTTIAKIDADEAAEVEAATLVAGDGIAGGIYTEVPCPAILEAVDPLIAEASRDDLTLIRGIDAQIAQELAGQGVTRFATIAAWTARDIAAIGTTAGLGRISKDNWIEQAALLAAGTMTNFAAAAVAARTPEAAESLQVSDTDSAPETRSPAEVATNVISLETHKRLAEGLVSRLPAKAAPSSQTQEALVIPFKAAQPARSATSNRWMLRIAACIALAAGAGLASLHSSPSSNSIAWVIGAL